MAGRGLVTGGLLLCGWLVTGAGHAYAAQVTAQAAPHELVTVTGIGSLLAGPAVALAGQSPVLERPALTSLAVPSFPGEAGVGAGNHSPAGVAGALAPAGSPAPSTAGPAAPGAAASLSPGPAASGLVRRAAAAAGRVVAGVTGPGARMLAGQVSSVMTGTGAPIVTAVGHVSSGTLLVITMTRPAGQPRALTPALAGAGRAAVRPVRLIRVAGPASVRPHPVDGRPGARSGRGHRGRQNPAVPMRQQAPGATPQADTAGSGSAASGSAAAGTGGAGTGQPVAQAPPAAADRATSGRLLRIMTSRWPARSQRSDDPAVSPD